MLNVAMWGRAIRVIPRITKDEWDDLDIVARWLIATRSAVIVMTLISSTIAGLLAYRADQFDWTLWLVTTLGLCFAHATNNLVNDITDHAKGVDKDNYFRSQYGPQPLEHGLLSKHQVMKYTVFTGAVALAAGVYLVVARGQITLTLLLIGVFFVLFYTWPLKYFGFGEPAVLVVWGPLMVGGAYYVVAGSWSHEVALASLPFALGATAVLFGKHIDKLEADRKKGIRTMPVLLGERLSRGFTVVMLAAQYLLVGLLIQQRYFSPILALVVLALPTFWLAIKAYKDPRPQAPPKEYPKGIWPLWFVAFAFLHTRRFGFLYLLAIVLDVGARKMELLS